MKEYKKKFQTVWMSTDVKPTGKDRQFIEASIRMSAKEDLEAELLELAMVAAEGYDTSDEITEALDCHYGHRACETCGKPGPTAASEEQLANLIEKWSQK